MGIIQPESRLAPSPGVVPLADVPPIAVRPKVDA